MNISIGIVTVLYNSASVIPDFIRTLSLQSYTNFRLYIIDNKSSDSSVELIKSCLLEYDVDYKLIENVDNYGVAKGNNQGIKEALADGCEYILLSNNDTILYPDTIELLVSGLNRTKADMVVPKILYPDEKTLWAAGGTFSLLTGSVFHYGSKMIDTGKFNEEKKIKYAPTCFMLIRSSIFTSVGYMDEKYFVYFDDVDFIYRANMKGFKLFYIPSSIMVHKESVSTGVGSNFSLYYYFRNIIYFNLKHRIHGIAYYYLYNLLLIKNSKRYTPEQFQLIKKACIDGKKMYSSR